MEKFQQEMVLSNCTIGARAEWPKLHRPGNDVRESRICEGIPNKGAHDLKRDLFIDLPAIAAISA